LVNTFTDAADVSVGDGRADSNAATDDQTTLRAAIQEANHASNPTYVFLPSGTSVLTMAGTGGDTQGDLDISKNVKLIGNGPGLSVIDAGAMSGEARIFDVLNGATLNVSRLSLTLGDIPNGQDGGGIRVQNGGILNLDYSAIVGNETGSSGSGAAIYFYATGSGSISNSVITVNHADDTSGGVYLAGTTGTGGTVTVANTIIAKNTDDSSSTPDIYVGANRTLDSLGNNRFTSAPQGPGFTLESSDHVEPVDYVVTTIVDVFDGTSDPVSMSIRDSINQANITAGAQEVWLPAWAFVLTLERTAESNMPELEISQGDLDITDSLTIRGIGTATTVGWTPGVIDRVFELVGDYNGDNQVTLADRTIWVDTQNSTADPAAVTADGDDNGVVDPDDEDEYLAHSDNMFSLLNVIVILPI
jgi:hypothetical protein